MSSAHSLLVGMDEAPAPAVARDPLTDFFWQGARDGRLLIQRCERCQMFIHLPRPVCRFCGSFDLAPAEVSGRGRIYSYTETHKAFHPFFVDRIPYLVAVVELDEQADLRVLSNLVGVREGDVRFGMDVVADFVWLSPDLAIPVFRPT